jgi:hypothetical protein
VSRRSSLFSVFFFFASAAVLLVYPAFGRVPCRLTASTLRPIASSLDSEHPSPECPVETYCLPALSFFFSAPAGVLLACPAFGRVPCHWTASTLRPTASSHVHSVHVHVLRRTCSATCARRCTSCVFACGCSGHTGVHASSGRAKSCLCTAEHHRPSVLPLPCTPSTS